MTRPYSSFVLRCWSLGGAEPRIKIEHIQSGQRTQVTTLEAAVGWIGAHGSTQFGECIDGSDPPSPTRAERSNTPLHAGGGAGECPNAAEPVS